MSNKKADKHGFVYSTNPEFSFEFEPNREKETIPPSKQRLRVLLDTRHRGGKAVTVIVGFIGLPADLEALGKRIKSYCGTGGSVKDGEILIQGNQVEKVKAWLIKEGYKAN